MLAVRSFTKPKLSKQGKDKVVKQDCHTTLSYKKFDDMICNASILMRFQ